MSLFFNLYIFFSIIFIIIVQVSEPVLEEKKSKKRKMDKREDLTGDERMAVEMYKAIKRNKTDLDDEETNSEKEDEDDDEDESEVEEKDDENDNERVQHNDDVELDDPGEAERRGITYKIAKNKVKLQQKIHLIQIDAAVI